MASPPADALPMPSDAPPPPRYPQVESFFGSRWPDSLRLIPDLASQYLANPSGALSTVKCGPWHLGGKFLLMGDAAHGVVPFYGQVRATFVGVVRGLMGWCGCVRAGGGTKAIVGVG